MATTFHKLDERPQTTNVQLKSDALLSARNLCVWFELRRWGFGRVGNVRAVDDVSFDLRRGEAVAVVGESGCGKSSLMKTILGLNKLTRGQIFFDGKDINSFNAQDWKWYRRQTGYVQQDPFGALAPFMTVRQILEEPLIVHGVASAAERLQRARKAMDEVRLSPSEDFLSKYPHTLSGGQQQRAVIARAMIMNPQLIVADEPVSMLDASVRVEILNLLRGLQEARNLAMIYITHDLSTVRYFADRIFVMYAGNLVEKSCARDLLKNPSHPYTRALLTAISDPDARNAETLKEIPLGEPPNLANPPTGCRFHPRCPKKIDRLCDVEIPPEFEISSEHLVACWLYK